MKIEVPDDLGSLTGQQLDVLEAQVADVLVNIRVHRRSTGKSIDALAGRPAWAKAIYRMADDKRSRFGIVLVVVAIAAGPMSLQSCGRVINQFQATRRVLATDRQ
jgi:hypothetical protein